MQQYCINVILFITSFLDVEYIIIFLLFSLFEKWNRFVGRINSATISPSPISKNIDDSKFSMKEVYKKYSSILCPFILLLWYYFKKIQFLRIECFMRAAF